jgi:hypothetical protein
MNARASRRRRMAAVVVLGTTLVGCLVGEVVARVVEPRTDLSGELYEPDPDTGHRLRPGRPSPGVTINSHGHRDPERPLEKPAGARRVLVLGDSFAFAVGLEDAEAGFTRRLEAALPGAQVVNTGVPGWGTVQQVAWLRREGARWAPDAIVLAFFVGNDVWENAGDPHALTVVDGRLVEKEESGESFLRALRNRSRLYRVLKNLPDEVKDLVTGDTRRARGYHKIELKRLGLCAKDPAAQASWEAGWTATREQLRALKELAAPAPVIVLAIPDEYQVSDALLSAVCARYGVDPASFDLSIPQRRLAAITTELGLELIDTFPELRRRTVAGETLYLPLDSHWNAAGHQLAADALAAALRRRGF